MAAPPSLKKLSRESFKGLTEEQGKLVDQILQILNPFLTSVTNGLSGSLSFTDNFTAQIVQAEFYLPDDWVTVTSFGLNWAHYDASGATYAPVGYRKDERGVVHLRGLAAAGDTGTSIFTLPTGFRPGFQTEAPALVSMNLSGSAAIHPGGIKVLKSGAVACEAVSVFVSGADTSQDPTGTAVTWVSLDGITFDSSDRSPPDRGSPFPLTVSCAKLPSKPTGLLVLDCDDLTTGKPVAAMVPDVTWEPATSTTSPAVLVRNISGLVPTHRYRLTMLAFS